MFKINNGTLSHQKWVSHGLGAGAGQDGAVNAAVMKSRASGRVLQYAHPSFYHQAPGPLSAATPACELRDAAGWAQFSLQDY